MKYPSLLEPATFIERPNRFLGVVMHRGERKSCCIPNPGRMCELMVPGTRVYLLEKKSLSRKTDYDMILVQYGATLISIDSRLPNKLLAESIHVSTLKEFHGYKIERMEPIFGDSRFDLLLCRGEDRIIVEAKSCTLVKDRKALFPDAPTKRGARHMNTLVNVRGNGRAAVIFVIQREDASEFKPNRGTDPVFTNALIRAVENGVEVYAYRSKISLESIILTERVPVSLE